MKLIPDWRHAWRWWSVRVSALGLLLTILDAIGSLWHVLPTGRLPAWLTIAVQLLLFVAVPIARIIQQRKATDDE